MSHKSEAEYIANTHNTARFFTEHRQVGFVLLIAVAIWGWYGYVHMPKRKDPIIPIRVAVASTSWPGATAEEVEQLVSRPVEQTMAQNAFVKGPTPADFGIRSISFRWCRHCRSAREISPQLARVDSRAECATIGTRTGM